MTTTSIDGRHDFDFWYGTWRGHQRKLADVTDPDCTDWINLDSESVAWPILGGLGNMDTIRMEGETTFDGVSFRMYDPETGQWKIWWASSRAPGVLDPPVLGSFTDGVGTFECDDTMRGRPVRVRYVWSDITDTEAQWRQYFRWDTDWVLNWHSVFTRTGGAEVIAAVMGRAGQTTGP
jgi:hypothetical protein